MRPRNKPGICVFGFLIFSLLAAGCHSPAAAPIAATPQPVPAYSVYVGTYTVNPKSHSQGIYRFTLNSVTGELTPQGLAIAADDPKFLAIHPNGRLLYTGASFSRSTTQPNDSLLDAFRLDPATAGLTFINQCSSGGNGSTHICIDHLGRTLLVANYGGATVAALPINRDGSLSPPTVVIRERGSSINPDRQKRAYPHSINLDPANHFAFVPDLGADKIFIYRFDAANHLLAQNDPAYVTVPPGSGPRHMVFDSAGRHAYVVNEMGNTVIVFDYDAVVGSLQQRQIISTLPPEFTNSDTAAEIALHPSGKFLYASNRGDDSIAIFSVDPMRGLLAVVGHQSTRGKTPRFFGIDPSGNWLIAANQESSTLTVFRINSSSGELTPVGDPVPVDMPVSLVFSPVSLP